MSAREKWPLSPATHKPNPQGRMESNREEALRYKPQHTHNNPLSAQADRSPGPLTLPVGSGPKATFPAPSNSRKNRNPCSRTRRQKPFSRPWQRPLAAARTRRLRRGRRRRQRMGRQRGGRGRGRSIRNIGRDGRIRSIRWSRLRLWSG